MTVFVNDLIAESQITLPWYNLSTTTFPAFETRLGSILQMNLNSFIWIKLAACDLRGRVDPVHDTQGVGSLLL